MSQFKEAKQISTKFLEFVNKSVSPWHATKEIKTRLLASGFEHLSEKESWKLKQNGKYFVTRNHSSIVTFTIGGKFKAGNGFKIIGAHTDSPDLKLKPNSAQEKEGMLQVGVQCYGGGLWHTWFDRDLTVAGRVICEKEDGKGFSNHLIHIKKPILKIPSLCIHLDRTVHEAFTYNKENHLIPVISSTIIEQLEQVEKKENEKKEKSKHHSILLDILANEIGCKSCHIRDFELSVVDTQPACLGGARDEFIFSPRLDNLMSCFTALESYFATLDSVDSDEDIRMVSFFDHEEIGSNSYHGAGSSLMADLISRITKLLSDENSDKDVYNTCIAKSFIISSDMAHAVHPNYSEKHEKNHKPLLHMGPVIKFNSNQRYATTSETSLVIKELGKRNNIPIQEVCVRNDSACGSTIGPILSSGLGIRTVDIGNPQWSMHSIRETCGTLDVLYSVQLFSNFFTQFRSLDNSIDE